MGDRFGIDINEASTWRGLVMFLSGLAGWHLSQEESEALVALGLCLSGVIGMFSRRNLPPNPPRKTRRV